MQNLHFDSKTYSVSAKFNQFTMLAALIITLRETLEAALVAGIILAYLDKTENSKHKKYVWNGVIAGIVVSAILAFVFEYYFGGFTGAAEEIYEGVMMVFAAGLLSWMIWWMLKQRNGIKKNLENKVSTHIKDDHPRGIFTLVFVSVLREGIETAIFLKAAFLASESDLQMAGAIAGIVIAIALAYVLFKGIAKVPLRKFFGMTSTLLILFAAGLLAHGIHEFQEAGVIPIVVEHVWDVNHIVNEKGTFGSILKGLFGYNGNPSLIEVISYLGYLVVAAITWKKIED